MSKIMNYLMLNQEKGKDLLRKQQEEFDQMFEGYDAKQVQEELENDPGYQKFLDELENNPF